MTTQVHAYRDGELSLPNRDAIETHLRGCDECRALLADLERLSVMLMNAPRREMPSGLPQRLAGTWNTAREREVRQVTGWLTAAAAVVLAGALAWWADAPSAPPARPVAWDPIVMPAPPSEPSESAPELALAEWIANDLSLDRR